MSFNRGKKRDQGFGHRNYNDRGNNMGGNMGGNMGSNMGNNMGGNMGSNMSNRNMGGGGVNPWESGIMPGRGILPTPNNNMNMSSPQAQLAVVSNILSNIFRTQQDNTSQVPSLLSLGNNYGGPMGPPGGGPMNQGNNMSPGQNFGGSPNQNFNQGRFNDRGGGPRQQMRNQRSHPYNNKVGNRARDGASGRRGPSSSQHSRNSGSMNGSQSHRNDKSSKANQSGSKQNQSVKKEPQDVKASDKTIDKSDLSSVKSETDVSMKSEMKTEVDTTQDTTADLSDVKNEENNSEILEESEKSQSEKESEKGQSVVKKTETRHAESRYSSVPINHMYCHVCSKHMWDGLSFENHLRGRAHLLMMEKLDQSYKLKVDLMRHELRVTEEQRELALSNSKRRGKKVFVDMGFRDYCTMCDLNFYGTLSSHRKSDKHQQLKTFLHPRCGPCSTEFPSRIEYDEHCLSPQHMRNAVENEEQKKQKKKDKLAKGEAEIRTGEDEEKDVINDSKSDKNDDSKEADEGQYLMDIPEELVDPKLKIPSYKYCRQRQILIGQSMVKEVKGFNCEKCRRFMLTEEDMQSHLRTITHYRNFAQEAKALMAINDESLAKEEEKADVDESMKSAGNTEETEKTLKRRRVSQNSENQEEVEEATKKDKKKDQESVDEAKEESDKKTPSSKNEEKYDPIEVDADESEDEEQHVEKMDEEKIVEEEPKEDDVDKLLDDMDDTECEPRNLIDDSGDEKIDDMTEDKIDAEEEIVEASSDDKKNETMNDLKEVSLVLEPIAKSTPRTRSGPAAAPASRARGNRARRSRR